MAYFIAFNFLYNVYCTRTSFKDLQSIRFFKVEFWKTWPEPLSLLTYSNLEPSWSVSCKKLELKLLRNGVIFLYKDESSAQMYSLSIRTFFWVLKKSQKRGKIVIKNKNYSTCFETFILNFDFTRISCIAAVCLTLLRYS
jgi:hypothetical protein